MSGPTLIALALDRHQQVLGELCALLELRAEQPGGWTLAQQAAIQRYGSRVEATALAVARTLHGLVPLDACERYEADAAVTYLQTLHPLGQRIPAAVECCRGPVEVANLRAVFRECAPHPVGTAGACQAEHAWRTGLGPKGGVECGAAA